MGSSPTLPSVRQGAGASEAMTERPHAGQGVTGNIIFH